MNIIEWYKSEKKLLYLNIVNNQMINYKFCKKTSEQSKRKRKNSKRIICRQIKNNENKQIKRKIQNIFIYD